MKKFKKKYRTSSLRLKSWDYSWNGAYFLTICVRRHECCLGNIENGIFIASKYGEIVKEFWEEIPQNFEYVFPDKFIIMPNHIHGIIIIDKPGNQPVETVHKLSYKPTNQPVETIHELSLRKTAYRRRMLLSRIIGRFKMQTAKQINIIRKSKPPFWQKNYYEHIIRNEKDLLSIQKYILENPLRWDFDKYNLRNINY